jgi:aspartate-semialdehyde dehydrogenase
MEKIKVGVIGASGLVGQSFLHLLSGHPWFEPVFISASDAKAGSIYRDVVKWQLPFEMTDSTANLIFRKMDIAEIKKSGARIIFSALPSDAAKEMEEELRNRGFFVFSNSSAMRYENNVPILIPEVNLDSIRLIEKQNFPSKGFIITNPNCCVAGLALAISPLAGMGIEELYVSTYQSVSGAGYPGVPSLDITGNAIPFIKDEEMKVDIEIKKIVGIKPVIFPFCVRISTLFGHLETVWLKIKKKSEPEEIITLWKNFKMDKISLPSSPAQPIIYEAAADSPQPKNAFHGSPPGMPVFTGRLRQIEDRIGFVLVVNNIIRGAAGGSIQNAEAFIKIYGDKL